jgi:hypothetical protein
MLHGLLSLFLAVTPPADAPPARVELPIRLVQGTARRFSVMVTINGQPVEAGLDTGSVGLRIMPTALPGSGGGEQVRIGFNAGVVLEGPAVRAQVAFGGLPATTVRVQRVERVSCRPEVPQCGAAGADTNTFRIMGDGVPGQGFPAILGIGLRDERLGHPLVQAGITRWIVDLPRMAGETGRLILNPGDDEVARYKQVRFLAGRNEVAGCLVTASNRVCAPTMVDTGAPGIQLFGGTSGDQLPDGTPATLVIGDGEASASMPVTIGRRDQAAGMRIRPPRPDARQSLSFGLAPYLRWSILYDARARTLGVADRQGAQ